MPTQRKWKSKPPVSQLDEAAAEHRRAQSRQAQRAFRQRKDDTIATLQGQVSTLESTIERLSGCFLRFNDKLLEHLRSVETDNGEALAESIRDSMNEYKEIIQCDDLDIAKDESGGSGSLGSSSAAPNGCKHSLLQPQIQLSHQTMSSGNTEAPTQQQQYSLQNERPTTHFSGPAFFGLTSTTISASHHTLEEESPASSAAQNHHALASRLYNSTVVKAFSIMSSSDSSDPVFRRVFAYYCSSFPPALAKQKVADMMQQRLTWSCFDKPLGSQRGWWSALQVAKFTCSQGWWFDRTQDNLVLRTRDGQVVIRVEELLAGKSSGHVRMRDLKQKEILTRRQADFLNDARCAIDDPEFRETTVISALARVTMGK